MFLDMNLNQQKNYGFKQYNWKFRLSFSANLAVKKIVMIDNKQITYNGTQQSNIFKPIYFYHFQELGVSKNILFSNGNLGWQYMRPKKY